MSLVSQNLVDIPEKGVIYRKIKNIIYVYYAVEVFRNNAGNPDNKRKLIGKKEEATGKLIPNNNYFEIFKIKRENINLPDTIMDYGNVFLMENIADKIGLSNILKKVFPNVNQELLTMAMYMLDQNNVMYYCEDWCERTYNCIDTSITSANSSKYMKDISFEHRLNFFKLWSKKMLKMNM